VERYSISFFGFDVLVGSDNIGTPKSLGPLQTTSHSQAAHIRNHLQRTGVHGYVFFLIVPGKGKG
jgi:hypothetical protein